MGGVAPPAFPVIVRPISANGAEHVPSKNPGSDVVKAASGKIVVNAGRAAVVAEQGLLKCAGWILRRWAQQAREAFEVALACASDAAPRCLFADWLTSQSAQADRARAAALYEDIVRDGKHWPRHAREHNREWLARAQSALAAQPQAGH